MFSLTGIPHAPPGKPRESRDWGEPGHSSSAVMADGYGEWSVQMTVVIPIPYTHLYPNVWQFCGGNAWAIYDGKVMIS